MAVMNDSYYDERTSLSLIRCIVTESETDDSHTFTTLHDPFSKTVQNLICCQQEAIRRQTRRLRAKAIAEEEYF